MISTITDQWSLFKASSITGRLVSFPVTLMVSRSGTGHLFLYGRFALRLSIMFRDCPSLFCPQNGRAVSCTSPRGCEHSTGTTANSNPELLFRHTMGSAFLQYTDNRFRPRILSCSTA